MYRTTQCRASRDDDGHEVRHRRACHHQTGRILRQAKHFCCPTDHLLLAGNRRMITAATVRIQSSGQHFGQDAYGGAGAMHPAKESRMSVADCIWREQPSILVVDFRHRQACARQRLIPGTAHTVRHRLPNRFLPNALKFIEQVVEHTMTERTQLRPMGRIQRCLGVSPFRHRRPVVSRCGSPPFTAPRKQHQGARYELTDR